MKKKAVARSRRIQYQSNILSVLSEGHNFAMQWRRELLHSISSSAESLLIASNKSRFKLTDIPSSFSPIACSIVCCTILCRLLEIGGAATAPPPPREREKHWKSGLSLLHYSIHSVLSSGGGGVIKCLGYINTLDRWSLWSDARGMVARERERRSKSNASTRDIETDGTTHHP